MTILKIKSMIYRYTGLFLAHKEQMKYVQSKEFMDEFLKIVVSDDGDMGPRSIMGLLIGSWQARNGFSTSMSKLEWHSNRFVRFIGGIHSKFINLYWDLRRLFRTSSM